MLLLLLLHKSIYYESVAVLHSTCIFILWVVLWMGEGEKPILILFVMTKCHNREIKRMLRSIPNGISSELATVNSIITDECKFSDERRKKNCDIFHLKCLCEWILFIKWNVARNVCGLGFYDMLSLWWMKKEIFRMESNELNWKMCEIQKTRLNCMLSVNQLIFVFITIA